MIYQSPENIWSNPTAEAGARLPRIVCSSVFQGWTLHNLSGKTISVFHHLHSKRKKYFLVFRLFQFTSVASRPVSPEKSLSLSSFSTSTSYLHTVIRCLLSFLSFRPSGPSHSGSFQSTVLSYYLSSKDVSKEDSAKSLTSVGVNNVHESPLVHHVSPLIVESLRLVKHNFTFLIPWWLFLITNLSSTCLETTLPGLIAPSLSQGLWTRAYHPVAAGVSLPFC